MTHIMPPSQEPQRDMERDLFGNGTLTVAARLSSVLMPFLMGLVIWIGREAWHDIKDLKTDKVEIAKLLATVTAKLDEQHRRNDQQDVRMDRLFDRIGANNAPQQR